MTAILRTNLLKVNIWLNNQVYNLVIKVHSILRLGYQTCWQSIFLNETNKFLNETNYINKFLKLNKWDFLIFDCFNIIKIRVFLESADLQQISSSEAENSDSNASVFSDQSVMDDSICSYREEFWSPPDTDPMDLDPGNSTD